MDGHLKTVFEAIMSEIVPTKDNIADLKLPVGKSIAFRKETPIIFKQNEFTYADGTEVLKNNLWYVLILFKCEPTDEFTLTRTGYHWQPAQSKSHARMIAKKFIEDGHQVIDIIDSQTRKNMLTKYKHRAGL